MCTLIAELLMLLAGVYALMAGKLKVTKWLQLEGRQARVAGLLLIAPVPLALLIRILIELLFNAGALPEAVLQYAGIVDVALVLLALIAVVVLARRKPAPGEPEPPAGLP